MLDDAAAIHAEGKEQIDQDLSKVSIWLFLAFLFGWAAVISRFVALAIGSYKATGGIPASGWIAQLFATFIWTLAWLAVAFVFGFIFGVPKVIARDSTPAGVAGPNVASPPSFLPRLKVNTNLEDISDWLTKVLVGATLTQVAKIPHVIRTIAVFMAGGDVTTAAFAFNAAILVYYSSLGFLSGYILTRMFFARAFAIADLGSDQMKDDRESDQHVI